MRRVSCWNCCLCRRTLDVKIDVCTTIIPRVLLRSSLRLFDSSAGMAPGCCHPRLVYWPMRTSFKRTGCAVRHRKTGKLLLFLLQANSLSHQWTPTSSALSSRTTCQNTVLSASKKDGLQMIPLCVFFPVVRSVASHPHACDSGRRFRPGRRPFLQHQYLNDLKLHHTPWLERGG